VEKAELCFAALETACARHVEDAKAIRVMHIQGHIPSTLNFHHPGGKEQDKTWRASYIGELEPTVFNKERRWSCHVIRDTKVPGP